MRCTNLQSTSEDGEAHGPPSLHITYYRPQPGVVTLTEKVFFPVTETHPLPVVPAPTSCRRK